MPDLSLTLIFLSSGLFLGWSLGANDAANVFGTAVSSGMIRFKTAAVVCSVFVLTGAVVSGSGATSTLSKLGSINQIAGAFTVALAAGLTVFLMTKTGLPVSTSQAIVGAIIGWNIFSGYSTDYGTLTRIVGTWVLCPVLSAVFGIGFYLLIKSILRNWRVHLLKLDYYNRVGLLVVGALGSYSLGANNIANVMGVFVKVSPFASIRAGDATILTSTQQLFMLGALAIGVGVFTYSGRVMRTVGSEIFRLSPMDALIVVLSSSIILFLFASEGLKYLLESGGLPSLPLVPVSGSQAVVGAVMGIGIVRNHRNINYKIIGKISSGWVLTPVLAGIIAFIMLFIMQNVFQQRVWS